MMETNLNDNIYKIHFGYFKGHNYNKALDLISLASRYETKGEGENIWHILDYTENQIELIAEIFNLVKNFKYPNIYGEKFYNVIVYLKYGYKQKNLYKSKTAEKLIREFGAISKARNFLEDTYSNIINNDWLKVYQKLKKEGYLGEHGEIKKIPKEHSPVFLQIRELIENRKYKKAISLYYNYLGDKPYGYLTSELLYLKRLANIQILGRDMFYFRPESTLTNLLKENIWEYCQIIDNVIENFSNDYKQTPLDILIKYIPRNEDFISEYKKYNGKHKYLIFLENKYKNLESIDSEIEHQIKHSNIWSIFFIDSFFQRGKLFDKYIDPMDFYLNLDDFLYDKKRDILVDIRYPIVKDGKEVVEKFQTDFKSCINYLLREGENVLREKHGVPRIGEGWISELELFSIVKKIFPSAIHNARPKWLKPQHLDIFIPDKKIAIEYQGKQHFEPVDFFGGEEAFKNNVKRDEIKKHKCDQKGIEVIYWNYDELINIEVLKNKLSKIK